jgi:hypothetical protein
LLLNYLQFINTSPASLYEVGRTVSVKGKTCCRSERKCVTSFQLISLNKPEKEEKLEVYKAQFL